MNPGEAFGSEGLAANLPVSKITLPKRKRGCIMKAFAWIAGGLALVFIIGANSGGSKQSQVGSPSTPVAYRQPGHPSHPLAPGWTPQHMPRDRHGIPVI